MHLDNRYKRFVAGDRKMRKICLGEGMSSKRGNLRLAGDRKSQFAGKGMWVTEEHPGHSIFSKRDSLAREFIAGGVSTGLVIQMDSGQQASSYTS